MAYDGSRKPGAWLTEQVARRERSIGRHFLVFGVASVFSVLAWIVGEHLVGASLFAAALCFAVATNDLLTAWLPWRLGERAEIGAGEELESLRYDGYIVMHDVMWGGQGNLDHVVFGPNGVFLVETKAGRYELRHLGRLKHLAKMLHDEVGCWVTPVICSGTRRKTFVHRGVVITGRAQLAEAIRSQPERGRCDLDRFHRWADTLV